MNSVYEPGSNGDSKTISSRKTRSKTNPGARAPKLAQLGTPRRVQTRPGARRPGRIVVGPGRVVAEAPGRVAAPVAVSQPHAVRPHEPQCPANPVPCCSAQRPYRGRVSAPCLRPPRLAARIAAPCRGLGWVVLQYSLACLFAP